MIRFQWSGDFYEFLYLCSGLGPAPRIFSEILKIPMLTLRWLNIKVIIYLDHKLLLEKTIQEVPMAKDAATLLQHLGFVIILEKSVLIPTPKIEF